MRNLPLVTPPQTANKRAAGWQIIATAIGATVIVMMFLWGINNQRDETAGQSPAATQTAPAQPAGDQQQGTQQSEQKDQGSNNASATTGQGSHQEGEVAQKANSNQQQKP